MIRTENIVKQYAAHRALSGVSIDVKENAVFGLLGPNGAGKTTLLRIINQITAPDSGVVYFNNRPICADDISQIGYLPEERGLYRKMKVGEQALYLAQLKGLSKADALKKLRYWFEKFEIQAWWDKKVEELSKGMQQKVQFITTVLHEPKLLIFDEPFSGFDPINANLLKNEILDLKAKGSTIIFSTHNMSSVEEICDSFALIHKSKVILNGEVDAIKETYKSNKLRLILAGEHPDFGSDLTQNFNLLEIKPNRGKTEILLQSDGMQNNTFLSGLVDHYHIHLFEEVIPTMNEIFIRVVDANQ